jgi:LPXTG-site transpeptidase (sortase) family protein
MPYWKRHWYVFPVMAGLLIIGLMASSALLFFHTNSSAPTRPIETSQPRLTTQDTPATIAPTPTPVPLIAGARITIASVGMNAPLENVGVASDGSLAVPKINPWTDAGWYQFGPYPGSRGSAVIDGHLDRPGGSPAVFWNLKRLKLGDSVIFTNAQGKAFHFKVTAMRYLAPNAPTASIFNTTSGAYLNLITCAGTWIPVQHQTTLRLVVYTTLVA